MKVRLILFTLLLPYIVFTQEGNFKWQNPLPHGNDLNGSCCAAGHIAWAVGDAGTIMRSTDKGVTWTLQNSGVSNRLGGVCFIDSLEGWVCGDNQTLLHTTDGGETWEEQAIPYINRLNDIQFINEDKGWAVGSERHILHTSDGGLNWDEQYSGTSDDLDAVYFADELHGYAVGWYGAFMRTTNGGESWIESQYFDEWYQLSSVFFINPDTGWICGTHQSFPGSENVILKTTNAGLSWIPFLTGNHYSADIWFTDPLNGYIASISSTLETSDGGESWIYHDWIDGAYVFNSISFFDQSSAICVGESSAVLRKPGIPDTLWEFNSPGPTNLFHGIDFIDHFEGWAVGYDDVIMHTENGGESWIPFSYSDPDDGYRWFCVAFPDSLHGWIGGEAGDLIYTRDGGLTWLFYDITPNLDLYSLFFLDSNYGWAVGRGDIRLKTINGGETWYGFPSYQHSYTNDVFFIDQLTGWVIGDDGFINKTVNGGTNWVIQNSNTTVMLYSMYFTDEMNGWIVGEDSTVLHTSDGGLNWIKDSNGGGASLQDVIFVNSNEGWITGENGLIMHTSDGGLNWEKEPVITDQLLMAADFTGVNNGWVCGTEGTILAYKPDNPIQVEEVEGIENRILVEIYPNPGHSSFTVTTKEEPFQKIMIFDLSGKLVKDLKFSQEKLTGNTITISVNDLTPGLYLLKIECINSIISKKIILH